MTPPLKPRILMVGPLPPTTGGVTTFMLNVMRSHLSADFEFVPFTTSRPPKRDVIENWGYSAIFRGGVLRIFTGIFVTLWHLLKFPFTVAVRSIDIVQIQASDFQVFWEAALYLQMARLLRRPVLMRIGGAFDLFHGQSPRSIQRLIDRVLQGPSCVIVQSQFARNYVAKFARPRNTIVLSNWSGVAVSPERSPAAHAPTFLFIAGTEAIRKGVVEVLAAAKDLLATHSAARFHIVAAPPILAERIAAAGLTNITQVEGPVAHERALQLMQSCDGFLLPSHGEGFPNSLVEAMAAGLPSIVTPVGAVPEIVEDGGALVVAAGDAIGLQAAIQALTDDPDLRRKLGLAAQTTVRRRYLPGVALAPLEAEYWRLLGRNRA